MAERREERGIWKRGVKRYEYGNIPERREEREIWEYGSEEKRERNIGILQRGGKREQYG